MDYLYCRWNLRTSFIVRQLIVLSVNNRLFLSTVTIISVFDSFQSIEQTPFADGKHQQMEQTTTNCRW